MKKMLFILTMAGLLSGLQAKANNAWLFNYDRDAITEELAQISNLEQFVNDHSGITLSMLQTDKTLTAGLGFDASDVLNTLQALEPPLGIPSFLWGACLGWVGILITYLVTDDKEETKKALIGCVVVEGVVLLLYIIIWVAILGVSFGALH